MHVAAKVNICEVSSAARWPTKLASAMRSDARCLQGADAKGTATGTRRGARTRPAGMTLKDASSDEDRPDSSPIAPPLAAAATVLSPSSRPLRARSERRLPRRRRMSSDDGRGNSQGRFGQPGTAAEGQRLPGTGGHGPQCFVDRTAELATAMHLMGVIGCRLLCGQGRPLAVTHDRRPWGYPAGQV